MGAFVPDSQPLPGGIEAVLPTRLTPDDGQNVVAYMFGNGFGQAARTLYAFGNHASPVLAWREEQMPVGRATKWSAICRTIGPAPNSSGWCGTR